MHKLLLSVIAIPALLTLNAQSLVTAKLFHGSDTQVNSCVATDNSGNIYTNCNFYGNVDADPGPGTQNFISTGSLDIAVTKLNSDGDFLWAIHLAGTGFSGISVLKTDNDGNIFVFGIFNGTIDMDPSAGISNLISSGTDDIFCAKYNSSGALIWAVKTGGTGTEQQYGFDLDSNGDLYLHGYFQNTIDFNPGAGIFNLTAGLSGSDFLLKLNNDGSFNYAILMAPSYGNFLMIDPSDNIYITGLFFGTIDFNPGVATYNLTAAGFGADCFILKLNSNGVFIWAGIISGNNSEQGTTIDYDPITATILVGGFYEGTIDVDPGAGITNIISAGYIDGFIVKLNASDGSFVWGKSFGGLGYQSVTSLKISSSGSIYATGVFEQTSDFDPSVATYNLTSSGSTDIFKFVWTNAGAFTSAEKIGGTLNDWAQSNELDNTGAEIIVGHFDGNIDFDPGAEVFNLNSLFTGWDGFLAKYCTVYTINNNVAICEGESYFAAGANQTEPGDYFDYYTPIEGCDSIVITHLTINNPVVDLGVNTGICSGSSIILNAENVGADYIWNTGANTQTITVSTAGTYSVTITDAAGCSATDAITITVNPVPNVNLGADVILCEGENIILNAGNPGANYLWNTGATTQTITASTTGNYSVTVTNVFGCVDNDLINVSVTATPEVDLGPNVSICSGTILTLDAENPGANYLWNTGATTQTINVTTAGIYSVEVSYLGDCSANDAITVTVNPNPDVNLGADISICADEPVILNAGNPGAEYNWNTGATSQTITATTSGNYSVIVTNAFGCSDNDLINVTIHALPVVDIGETINICSSEELILNAANPGSTYLWNTGATTQTISITTEGIYEVDVTTIFGCASSDDVTVIVDPTPAIDLGTDITFCDGGSVILDATSPSCIYSWNTGATTSTINVTETGIYSVIVTNPFGCSDTDFISVDVFPLPIVDLGDDISFCEGGSAILDATNPSSSYLWSTGEISPTITIMEAGIYSVTITNDFGCTAFDEITVGIFSVPIFDLGSDIIFCDGASATLDATLPSCTYMWSTGETSSTIIITEEGNYSVVVTNSFGCTAVDEISVMVNPSPVVTLLLPNDMICSDAAPIILSGGSPAGGIYTGVGVTDGIFDAAIAGLGFHTITYSFTDINGCSAQATQDIEVTICQAIENAVIANSISIFPNPAIDHITIKIPAGSNYHKLEIKDITGKLIISENISMSGGGEIIYTLDWLPAGNYYFFFTGDNNVIGLPVIIIK